MLICLGKHHKFKQGEIKERRREAARLHIEMDRASLTKTVSSVTSTSDSNITSLADVFTVSFLRMNLANGWLYHSKRLLSTIRVQYLTSELYHQSVPVSNFAEPEIRLFPM